LLRTFYQRIWNDGNLDAEAELLTPDFSFRGSLGLPNAGTGKLVQWLGAALFRFEDSMLAELWVLGDLAGLAAQLQAQATDREERQ